MVNIALPWFNIRTPIKTRYGYIYIKVISPDEVNIIGFELSIPKTYWFFGTNYDNINHLNYMVMKIMKNANIETSEFFDHNMEEPEIVHTDYHIKIPKIYTEYNADNKSSAKIEDKKDIKTE